MKYTVNEYSFKDITEIAIGICRDKGVKVLKFLYYEIGAIKGCNLTPLKGCQLPLGTPEGR